MKSHLFSFNMNPSLNKYSVQSKEILRNHQNYTNIGHSNKWVIYSMNWMSIRKSLSVHWISFSMSFRKSAGIILTRDILHPTVQPEFRGSKDWSSLNDYFVKLKMIMRLSFSTCSKLVSYQNLLSIIEEGIVTHLEANETAILNNKSVEELLDEVINERSRVGKPDKRQNYLMSVKKIGRATNVLWHCCGRKKFRILIWFSTVSTKQNLKTTIINFLFRYMIVC